MLNFTVDTEKCIQCTQCAKDCPVKIIRYEDGYPNIASSRESRCLRCMHCLAVCPTGAISILDIDPENCTPLKNNLPSDEQLETLMKGRRSVRRFKKDNVDRELIDRLIDVAVNGPTAKNAMRMNFSVVDDNKVMEKIIVRTYEHIGKAVKEGRVSEQYAHFKAFNTAFEGGTDIIFRKAPHMLVVSSSSAGSSPATDVAIACTHFDLAATNAGLGSLWCGFAKQAFEGFVPEYKELLGIPEGDDHLYIMMFGHPAVKYYRTVQRSFQKVYTVQLDD